MCTEIVLFVDVMHWLDCHHKRSNTDPSEIEYNYNR